MMPCYNIHAGMQVLIFSQQSIYYFSIFRNQPVKISTNLPIKKLKDNNNQVKHKNNIERTNSKTNDQKVSFGE